MFILLQLNWVYQQTGNQNAASGVFICQEVASEDPPRRLWYGAGRKLPLFHQSACGHMLVQCTSLALRRHCPQQPLDGSLSSAFPR